MLRWFDHNLWFSHSKEVQFWYMFHPAWLWDFLEAWNIQGTGNQVEDDIGQKPWLKVRKWFILHEMKSEPFLCVNLFIIWHSNQHHSWRYLKSQNLLVGRLKCTTSFRTEFKHFQTMIVFAAKCFCNKYVHKIDQYFSHGVWRLFKSFGNFPGQPEY